MFKWLFRAVLVALLAIGAYYAYHWDQARRVVAAINAVLDSGHPAGRRMLALDLSQGALDHLKSPNIYAFVGRSTLAALSAKSDELAKSVPALGDLDQVTVRPKALRVEDAELLVDLSFSAQVKTISALVDGTATIVAAPGFDGASLTFYPVDARVQVTDVRVGSRTDSSVLPALINVAMRPLAAYLTSRVGSIAVPLELGVARDFDLAESFRGSAEIKKIEDGKAHLYMAMESSAVLATADGLHIIAAAHLVPESDLNIAKGQFREAARKIPGPPPEATCPDCDFSLEKADEYIVCLRRSLDCRADRALKVTNRGSALTPVQSLALRQMAAGSESDRQAYTALSFLLTPTVRPTGAPIDDGQFGARFGAARQAVLKARDQVEPAASFSEGKTVIAVRKDLIASSLNNVASQMAPRAEFAIESRQEQFKQTIKTDPAPDLRCAVNQMGCPSNFDADYDRAHPYTKLGCESNCDVTNCVDWGLLGKHCVTLPDAGCLARKTACEIQKAAKDAEHAANKEAERIIWTAKKTSCETVKALQRAGCDLNQAWLNASQNTDLGEVKGNVVISSAGAQALLSDIQVSKTIDRLSLAVSVSGSADVNASFVFTPLNAGHLACVAQWGGDVRAKVSLPPTKIDLVATLNDKESATTGDLVYDLAEVETKVQTSPAPGIALLTQNPQMALVCPAVGAFVGANPVATGIALQLSDTVKVKVPARQIRLPLSGGPNLVGLKPRVKLGSNSVLLVIEGT
jgi:hypothetical protein